MNGSDTPVTKTFHINAFIPTKHVNKDRTTKTLLARTVLEYEVTSEMHPYSHPRAVNYKLHYTLQLSFRRSYMESLACHCD